jgi:NAD-dependent SIR2 family protein deacetylase
MHPQPYPTRPQPALHPLHGLWVASCSSCGFQLATARSQQRAERRGAQRVCPVCHEEGR